MSNQKRQRQRAGRAARHQQQLAAERRASIRRRMITVGVIVAIVAVIGVGMATLSDDDSADSVASDTTTETDDGGDPFEAIEPGTAECPDEDGASERRIEFDGPPRKCIDTDAQYTAVVETDVGTIRIALDAEAAPLTVNNFVFLARYHFYDGVPFHRVIPQFVVQGGDAANQDGTGGPGYQIPDELPEPGDYRAGSLAMANSGPDTNGSQFFIVTSEQGAATLVQAVGGTANYSLFGQVVEGLEVVQRIEADGDPSGTPKVVHRIESVTIEEA